MKTHELYHTLTLQNIAFLKVNELYILPKNFFTGFVWASEQLKGRHFPNSCMDWLALVLESHCLFIECAI
jgi:hypothetical protein